MNSRDIGNGSIFRRSRAQGKGLNSGFQGKSIDADSALAPGCGDLNRHKKRGQPVGRPLNRFERKSVFLGRAPNRMVNGHQQFLADPILETTAGFVGGTKNHQCGFVDVSEESPSVFRFLHSKDSECLGAPWNHQRNKPIVFGIRHLH